MVESDTPPMSVPAQQISARSPDRLTLIAFGAFILLAGGAPVAIRGTYEQLTPYWSATLRFGTAALIFWLLMLVRGIALPRGRALLGALVFGALNVGAAFLFVYYGLTKVGASLASTVTATVPLLTLFFAAAHKIERLRRQGLLGGLLVLAGIAISVSSSLKPGSEASLVHILLILAGAACFAEAGIVIKLFPPCNAYATNAIAMSTGTLILATASLVLGESWVLPSLTSVWLFLLYLALGSVVAFLLYMFIIGRWTATGASYAFVLNPLVTVVLATFLTDEAITATFLAGAAVVLLGVYVGALRPSGEPVEATAKDVQARPAAPSCM